MSNFIEEQLQKSEDNEKLKKLHAQVDKISEDLDKLIAMTEASLKKNAETPPIVEEVAQLKEEVAQLKKENADLKQQLKDMWNSMSAFFEKHASSLGNKWSAFFAKNKEPKVETAIAENSNTFQL